MPDRVFVLGILEEIFPDATGVYAGHCLDTILVADVEQR